MIGSCDGNDTNEVIVLAGGVTETVTISGGEEVVIVSGTGGGGGGGGGVASLAVSGAEVTSSSGGGVAWAGPLSDGVGGAVVLPSSPAKPCTMLLKPLTPSQIIPSRFSQKFGRSDMIAVFVFVGEVY